MSTNGQSESVVVLEDVGVHVHSVGVVLIVLPHVRQRHVQAAAFVPLKLVFSEHPVEDVVRVSQVLGVLVDAALVVSKPRPVDHVADLRDVELVQLPERGEHVHRLAIADNLTVKYLH